MPFENPFNKTGYVNPFAKDKDLKDETKALETKADADVAKIEDKVEDKVEKVKKIDKIEEEKEVNIPGETRAQKILREHGGLISNIPIGHAYWNLRHSKK